MTLSNVKSDLALGIVGVHASDQTSYDDPSSKIWSVYVDEAEAYDKVLMEGWVSDMDGILIFVCGLNLPILSTILCSIVWVILCFSDSIYH